MVIGDQCSVIGSHARTETETIDLKALAKNARPAVMLLVVSDANGKEIATGTGFLVSSDGKLITNHHVIEGAAKVKVTRTLWSICNVSTVDRISVIPHSITCFAA